MAAKGRDKRRGLILVHTGNGKGKTTAAMGTALRAVGQGFKVGMFQFIKGRWKTGEERAIKRLAPSWDLVALGEGFLFGEKDFRSEHNLRLVREGWERAKAAALSGTYDLVIFDEINYVLSYGMLPAEEVVQFLKERPPWLHVILTGRDARPEIIEMADLVTEMRQVKHPYDKGIVGQRGIEY